MAYRAGTGLLVSMPLWCCVRWGGVKACAACQTPLRTPEQGYAALERIPPQDRGKSRLLHNLGRLLHEQRHMESAEKLMLQAVKASSADDDPLGYNTLSRKNNLGR